MGATSHTPVLGLPQYTTDDKPAWLTDINASFLAIDNAVGSLNARMNNLEFEAEMLNTGRVVIIEDTGTNFGATMYRFGRMFMLYLTNSFSVEGASIMGWAHVDGNPLNLVKGEIVKMSFNTLDTTGGDTHIPGGNIQAHWDPLAKVTVFDLTDMPTTPAPHVLLSPVIFVRSDFNVCN